MPTDRDLLVSALRHLAGAGYDRTPPYEPGTLDCVRFTYAVLRDLWPDVIPQYHAELHVMDAADPFSPITAVAEAGVGKRTRDRLGIYRLRPGCWHLCQGWKSLEPLQSGHAWLWYEPASPVMEPGLIVQATNAGRWVEARYWEDQVKRFPHVRLAVLNLDG
jgi:hypothetical protein